MIMMFDECFFTNKLYESTLQKNNGKKDGNGHGGIFLDSDIICNWICVYYFYIKILADDLHLNI